MQFVIVKLGEIAKYSSRCNLSYDFTGDRGRGDYGKACRLMVPTPSALIRHTMFFCAKISLKWVILSPLFGTIVMFCSQVISIPVTQRTIAVVPWIKENVFQLASLP